MVQQRAIAAISSSPTSALLWPLASLLIIGSHVNENKVQLQAISPRSDRNANHPKDRRAAEGTAISIYASHFTMACPLNCPQSPCCPHRACWLKYVPCYTIVSQRTLAIQSYAVTRRLYWAASAHGRVVYYVRVSMQKADMQVCYACSICK